MISSRLRRFHVVTFFDAKKSLSFSSDPRMLYIGAVVFGFGVCAFVTVSALYFVSRQKLHAAHAHIRDLKVQIIASHMGLRSEDSGARLFQEQEISRVVKAQSALKPVRPRAEPELPTMALAAKNLAFDVLKSPPPGRGDVGQRLQAVSKAPPVTAVPMPNPPTRAATSNLDPIPAVAPNGGIGFSDLQFEDSGKQQTSLDFIAKSIKGVEKKGRFCFVVEDSKSRFRMFPPGNADLSSWTANPESLEKLACQTGIASRFKILKRVEFQIPMHESAIKRVAVIFTNGDSRVSQFQYYVK